MKKTYILLILVFIISLSARAQLGISMPPTTACPGDTILVPVHATGFNDIGAITLFIKYNAAVLTYLGHTNLNPALIGLLSNAMTVPMTQVGIVWNASLAGVNLGSASLFDLKFVYQGGSDSLIFLPGCEVANFAAVIIPALYNNGPVNQGIAPLVLISPNSATVCEGSQAQFIVTASGVINYQWQVNTGSSWSDLNNTGVYSGVNTSTLNISASALSMNGNLYRCVCIGFCNTYSQTATLNVTQAPTLSAGIDDTICAGATSVVTGASAAHYSSFSWSSSGTGNFTSGGSLSPTYYPSNQDTITKIIYLKLNVQGNYPCGLFKDSLKLTINALPYLVFPTMANICLNANPLALNTALPTGGTYSGTGVTNAVFYPATAGVGTHPIQYSYTSPLTQCSNTKISNIQVLALPVVTLSTISQICLNASPFTLSGGSPAGGTYSINGINATTFNPSVLGVGNHIVRYTYTNPGTGCSDYKENTIQVLALPTVTLSSFSPLCLNSPTLTLSGGAPLGGTYSGTGVSGGVFNPLLAGVGTHIITYTYTNPTTTCSNFDQKNIIVNALPVVIFDYTDSLCVNGVSQTLSGTPVGGVFTGPGISGSTFNPLTAGVGIHWVKYTYTHLGTGCVNADSAQIKVNPAPIVTLTSFNQVCIDATPFALSGGSPAGGTYTGNSVVTGVFYPASAGAGTFNMTYSYTSPTTGCSNSDIKPITVNALPTIGFPPLANRCLNSPPLNLTMATPAGGNYSGTGVTTNVFNAGTAGVGTHTITYTYTNPSTTCTNSATQPIVVNALPVVDFTFTDSLCLNDPPQPFSGTPAGGIFSGAGISGSSMNPATAGVGLHWIKYTYTAPATGCTNADSVQVKVLAIPIVTLTSFNQVCIDATPFALSGGNPAGGTYTGNSVVTGVFYPASAGAGTFNMTYSYTSPTTGCSNSDIKPITVNALPTIGFPTLANRCLNSPPLNLTMATPAGGNYSGTGVTTNVFNAGTAGVGTHTITYTYTNPSTTCTNSAAQPILVNSLPVVDFTYNDSLCLNALPQALSGTPTGGTFSGPGVSANSINPALSGVGLHWVLYSYTAPATGCTNTDSAQVKVLAIPTVTLNPYSAVCVDATPFLLSGGSPAGGNYSGSGVSAGIFSPAIAGAGSHTITYTYLSVASGCSNSDSEPLVVNALPVINFPALSQQCINSPGLNLNTATPSGGTYSGTGVVSNVFYAATAGVGTHTITYNYTSPTTTCTNSATQPIVVNALPVVNLPGFGPPYDVVCNNEPLFALFGGTPAGGSYSGTGVNNNQFNPSLANVGANIITYTYTDPLTTCSGTATTGILVHAAPNVAIGTFPDVCFDDPAVSLSSGTPSGGTYSGNGVSGTTFYPYLSGVGTHFILYSFTDLTTACSNSDSSAILVKPLPLVNLGNDTTICKTHILVLNAGAGQQAYLWSNAATTQTITLTGSVLGPGTYTYNVLVTGQNSCKNSDTIEVIVDPCDGIDELSQGLSMNIFPNPAHHSDVRIVAVSRNGGEAVIEIRDLQGRLLHTRLMQLEANLANEILLDLDGWSSGIYSIHLKENSKVISRKLIVTR
jgi:hypothetical protein